MNEQITVLGIPVCGEQSAQDLAAAYSLAVAGGKHSPEELAAIRQWLVAHAEPLAVGQSIQLDFPHDCQPSSIGRLENGRAYFFDGSSYWPPLTPAQAQGE